MTDTSASLLRVRHGHEHSRVTFVELFFDLVFVFAITQLSHTLLEHLSRDLYAAVRRNAAAAKKKIAP